MLDAIVAAENKTGPHKVEHNKNKNAKLGIYKYNTKIAFPVNDAAGNVTGYNVYSAQMIVNHTSNGKLELYDIIDINKDDQSALKLLNESARGSIKMIRPPRVAYKNNLTQNNQTGKTRLSRAQLDSEYQDAVESGDLEHAEEMLLEKLQRTEGIVAFNAPHGYGGQHKDIANKYDPPNLEGRSTYCWTYFLWSNSSVIFTFMGDPSIDVVFCFDVS